MNENRRKWWINQIRRAYTRTGLPAKCIRKQFTGEKEGRAYLYWCEKCKKKFKRKDLQADHIAPVVNPATGFTTFDEYIERIDVGIKKLQCLCKKCHTKKSTRENRKRSKNA